MAESDIFLNQLKDALKRKAEWFDNVRLPELLDTYKTLQGCTKNLQEVFTKKTIIMPDPYRTEKILQDITIPETSSFTDKEASSVFGSRFSDYASMLDFLCATFNFTVDNLTIPKIKKLLEFNGVFQWNLLSSNCIEHSNTKALANAIAEAKNNTPEVIISMISDCVERNDKALSKIDGLLKEVVSIQKEMYKYDIRMDIIGHEEFNKEKAFTSPDNEMAEIKRIYAKVMGKNPFYTEFIKELIQEDLASNKNELRMGVLKRLALQQEKSKKSDSMYHEMLLNIVLSIASLGPTLTQLKNKLILNLDLVFKEKKSLFGFLRKIFHLKRSDRVCAIQVAGSDRLENLKADEFIAFINSKEKLYSSLASNGTEFDKLDSSSDEAILAFITKQIGDCQAMFTKFNGLDEYFKRIVDVSLVPRIKGTQIERAAMRSTIVNATSKREDYINAIKEAKRNNS